MTYLSRDTYARTRNAGRHSTTWRRFGHGSFILIAILVSLPLIASTAGTYTRTDFPLIYSSDSNMVPWDAGIGLKVDRWDIVKIFGDSSMYSPKQNAVPFSICSDVVAGLIDTFTFFWADSVKDSIIRKDVILALTGSVPSSPRPFCRWGAIKSPYLHVDKGESGFCATFVEQGTGVNQMNLMVSTGGSQAYRDTLDQAFSGVMSASQCRLEKDTFLIINGSDFARINLRKVFARTTTFQVKANVQVTTGLWASGNCVMNCSVAADENGDIIVTWLKGSPEGPEPKTLYYRFYNRNLSPLLGGMVFQGPDVCDNTFNYYDDVPVVSIGPGVFMLATWDASGVFLNRINLSDGGLSATKVINKPGAYLCALQANSRYLTLACRGDVDGNGRSGIEGIRYIISNGNLITPQNFAYSSPASSVTIADRYSTAINVDMDSSGSIGTTWRNNLLVQGSAWANRGVRFRRGYWTSPVETLDVQDGDSIKYYPATLTISSLSSWYAEDSIRVGCTTGEFTNAKPWISLSSAAALQNLNTNCKYFQIRTTINRKPLSQNPDSISTPFISGISIPWDAQPVIGGIDSLFVNSVFKGDLAFDETVDIFSRSDTIRIFMQLRDSDPSDQLRLITHWPSRDTNITLNSPLFKTPIRFRTINRSDTTVTCSLSTYDTRNWYAVPRKFMIRTHNATPVLAASAAYTLAGGTRDTTAFPARIDIQTEDSIEIFYSATDSNDTPRAKAYVSRYSGSQEIKQDSVGTGTTRRFIIKGDTATPTDSVRLRIFASDPDVSVEQKVTYRVNHPPRIVSLTYDNDTVSDGDTIRILAGDSVRIHCAVHDTDLTWWDTVVCRYNSRVKDDSLRTKTGDITIPFLPTLFDTLVNIIIRDTYSRSDSIHFHLKFPWFDLDSVKNPDYYKALDTLRSKITLIAGSDSTATVKVPFVNSGNDTMSIVSMRLTGSSWKWLTLNIPQDTGYKDFTSISARDMIPIRLEPDSTKVFTFRFSAQKLLGDSVLYDTMLLTTSDPLHPCDTIPLRLEFNDLPRVLDIMVLFDPLRPYTPYSSAKRRAGHVYKFPPHAQLSMNFTEPMDSLSALRGIKVYSVLDSIDAGQVANIGLDYTWSQNYTRLIINAHYDTSSTHFNISPPRGLFIPTDSLRLVLTPDLTDRASTPSGPNGLDYNRDYKRDAAGDTMVPFRVDSISFAILAVNPALQDTGIKVRPVIQIMFTAPVYAVTVDTSLINNKTLIVCSSFNGGKQIAFDSVAVDGSTITFRPAIQFFYNDSVWCRYRGATVKDMLGFPADNTNDGIPAALFDTSSQVDDYEWYFHIRKLRLVSVTPDNGTTVNSLTPSVTLAFSEPVPPDIFDSDTTSSNRSFTMQSSYEGGKAVDFRSIVFSQDRTSVTLIPKWRFFSNDSISCLFKGFTLDYRYDRTSNLPNDSIANYEDRDWYFNTGTIGFYTYPNPFKPNNDPRHCPDAARCGIWFKNLHTLKEDLTDVNIKIFSVRAFPVYDTEKAGVKIHFTKASSEMKPQWLWNTKNQAGEPVASGLYFYVIYDLNKVALIKGKLVIVR